MLALFQNPYYQVYFDINFNDFVSDSFVRDCYPRKIHLKQLIFNRLKQKRKTNQDKQSRQL
jgi:hypothetical protein